MFTLAIIFVILKLTGNIDWSWWWVLSPLLVDIVFIVVSCAISCYVEKKYK